MSEVLIENEAEGFVRLNTCHHIHVTFNGYHTRFREYMTRSTIVIYKFKNYDLFIAYDSYQQMTIADIEAIQKLLERSGDYENVNLLDWKVIRG